VFEIMKTQLIRLVLLAALPVASSGMTPLHGQETPKPATPPTADDPRQLARPGAEHTTLARYAGTWELTVTMGSGAKAVRSTGMATNQMLVGGRFLQMNYAVNGAAGELAGQFTLGFDSRHQRYALVALDTFGNYFITSHGPRDAETGRLKLRGTDDDPAMKALGYTKEFLHVIEFKAPDEFVLEVWFVDTRTAARREFKFMDYTFRRPP